VQVHGGEIDRSDPGEIQELAQQPVEPVAFLDDEPAQGALVLVGLGRERQLLDRLRIEASGFRISWASGALRAATAAARPEDAAPESVSARRGR
jgi:hypothetical protein